MNERELGQFTGLSDTNYFYSAVTHGSPVAQAEDGGLLPAPEFLFSKLPTDNTTFCGRVNIMGTIVQDSAPYLFPFIIEYSLIGAAVIYIMWRHIGRYPR